MSVFAGQKCRKAVAVGNTESPIGDACENKNRSGTFKRTDTRNGAESVVHVDTKVRHIRRQLADNKYDIDTRLNVVIDKLLKKLVT